MVDIVCYGINMAFICLYTFLT